VMLPLLLILSASDWVIVLDDGNSRVERRLRQDGLMEIRGTTTTDVPAEALAEAFWSPKRKPAEQVKLRVELRKDDKEKVVYQQLRLPIVKDRDYVLRIERHADPENHLFQFKTRCESSLGPPPNDEHVRVTDCFSVTTMEGQPSGTTLLSYEGHADPAGSLPKWIVNMLAPRTAADVLKRLITEARDVARAK
jgi:hypothetical protein